MIGRNTFIGINALVKNKVNIGEQCTVAMGAVVVKNVADKAVVLGNPAEPIETARNWNIKKKELLKEQSR
jgi:acetyltransferase-like isoleucine patch superfamily enzyme